MSKGALYFCAALHGIGLVITVVNMVFQILFVKNTKIARKKVGVTDKLIIGWSVTVFCSSTTYYLNAFSGFDRLAATVDGVIGSAPTALCSVQSFLVTWMTMQNAGYALLFALNVYLPIVRGWKPRDLEAVEKWFHIYPIALGSICAIVASSLTTAGPLAFWCWIICEETGLPSTPNLNPGMCWVRILALYGPLILNCLACLGMLIPLVIILLSHVRKSNSGSTATSGGGEGAKKGFNKTVIFLVLYSGMVIGASAGRVRGALSPSEGDGNISVTEYSAALIPIAVVGMFAVSKWFNPFAKQQKIIVGDGGASQRSTATTKGATDAGSSKETMGSEKEDTKKSAGKSGVVAITMK
jgi:hypothetical protein